MSGTGRRFQSFLFVGTVILLVLGGVAQPVGAQPPVVQAVLYYSPTCPHCHTVMREDLPPLFGRFEGELQILFIDVTSPIGQQLYDAAITALGIPPERQGVPTLVLAGRTLVGSLEIPAVLPDLIAAELSAGGVSWPAIPGLEEALARVDDYEGLTLVGSIAPGSEDGSEGLGGARAESPDMTDGSVLARIARDPVGNSLAIAVLAALAVTLAAGLSRWRSTPSADRRQWTGAAGRLSRWIPALLVLGLGVAGYLATVEVTDSDAICGPVGDCRAVQSSPYARLFGVPLGLLGVVGYLALIGAWVVAQGGRRRARDLAVLAFGGLAFGGTLLSLYLTILEPFVLGATCAWCLTSALVMAALFWLSSGPARLAYERLIPTGDAP